MKKIHKEVLELKRKLAEAKIDDTNLVYMPIVPFVGEHNYVVEEHFGMKVARLISPPND